MKVLTTISPGFSYLHRLLSKRPIPTPTMGVRCEIEGRLAHPNRPSVISLVTYQVSHSFCLHLSHEARETRRMERR